MEWALEKATEMGVASIVPVIAQRSEKHLASSAGKRVQRWRRMAHEASQQARRASVPQVSDPVKLKEGLADSEAGVGPAEAEAELCLKKALAEGIPSDSLSLAIGPGGGWTPQELETFRRENWQAATLEKPILRTETATVAALAIAISELT